MRLSGDLPHVVTPLLLFSAVVSHLAARRLAFTWMRANDVPMIWGSGVTGLHNFQHDVYLFTMMLHPQTAIARLVLPFLMHGHGESWCGQFSFILNDGVFLRFTLRNGAGNGGDRAAKELGL